MTSGIPSVLCPVDFSEPSRTALVYAAAVADHFGARLTVLAVDDPLLAEAAAATGRVPSLAEETEVELRRFGGAVLGDGGGAGPKQLHWRVAIGKPAVEILRAARELEAGLIVMSSRGHSGVRKMFFGSTTERVLRETPVPVLVTPADRRPERSLSGIARHVNRVVAPVDLTAASRRQLVIAAAIAEAVSVPLIIAHVLEPVFIPFHARMALAGADATRRAHAEDQIAALTAAAAVRADTEPVVLGGDPAEEIVKLSDARQAGLIVMGLHSPEPQGPRMGSVTYRVLCLSRALVLAVPPVTSD